MEHTKMNNADAQVILGTRHKTQSKKGNKKKKTK